MPAHNLFRHQNYPTQPALPVGFVSLNHGDATVSRLSELHTRLKVHHVMVVHGTFVGTDPLAIADILSAMADGAPVLRKPLEAVAARLQELQKPLADRLTRDIGNYTEGFVQEFQRLVGDDPAVRLMQPTWSGQNHHFARADLAVRLLCQLDDLQPSPDRQVLLWGHSHAGNGFALLTNLLANDPEAVHRFFEAAGPQQATHWLRAEQILKSAPTPHPWASAVMMAAFGTPVRYGWDTRGCRHLIHILHHRNYDAERPLVTQPLFPPHSVHDITSAAWGDWVQAFAIAGTDVVPPTATKVNRDLTAVLEEGLVEPAHEWDTRFIAPSSIADTCARWKTGTRCHTDGHNLLVQYEPSGRLTPLGTPIEESIFGHGVATTIDWLPAHLSMVLETLLKVDGR